MLYTLEDMTENVKKQLSQLNTRSKYTTYMHIENITLRSTFSPVNVTMDYNLNSCL